MANAIAWQIILILTSIILAVQVVLGADWMDVVIRTSIICLALALALFGSIVAVAKLKPAETEAAKSNPEKKESSKPLPASAGRPTEKTMAKTMR